MPDFAEPLARLIAEFKHLPGIGQKSAQRLAFHVLRAGRSDAERLSQAILDVKDKLGLCRVCNNISESELCLFCRDPNRNPKLLCVVEEAHNILGIEVTRQPVSLGSVRDQQRQRLVLESGLDHINAFHRTKIDRVDRQTIKGIGGNAYHFAAS